MTAEQVFRAKAPGIMAQLLRDYPITPEDTAAILGNLGHESAGLTILREIKPTVAGSKGGYGWPMWTGARRRAYEAYCARTGKAPTSDDANYAYLFLELKGIEGSEGKAIGKLVAAKGLDAKVEAFEKAFLRAGVKHCPSRKQWARVALDAWRSKSGTGIPIPEPTPQLPPEAGKPGRMISSSRAPVSPRISSWPQPDKQRPYSIPGTSPRQVLGSADRAGLVLHLWAWNSSDCKGPM